jgi:hypothetical protein
MKISKPHTPLPSWALRCFSITKLTYAKINRTRRPTSGLRPAYVPGTPTLGHSITRLRALRAVAPTLLPGLCDFFGRKGSRPGYVITGAPLLAQLFLSLPAGGVVPTRYPYRYPLLIVTELLLKNECVSLHISHHHAPTIISTPARHPISHVSPENSLRTFTLSSHLTPKYTPKSREIHSPHRDLLRSPYRSRIPIRPYTV